EGTRMLGVMERHLRAHTWFVGERESLADLALYAYTHVAEEGGFDLGDLPAVREWIARVADHPRHVAIDA
ncbi:MAG TPA: glutathione binding-like protein, partial [Planctomycetota bacterium]